MQRRRSHTRERSGPRTLSLPSTPPAQVVYFPKGRDRSKTEVDALPGGRTPTEVDTDPLGEEAQRAMAARTRRPQARQARTLTPDEPDRDALTYHRLKLEKLLRGDRRALEGLKEHELMEVAVLGHGLYEQGRLHEARVVFEGLVAMEPREAFPYTVLGAIFLAQQDLHRALALFEAALELDPDDPAPLCYRGEIRLQLGQRAKGLSDLRRALALDTEGSPFAARARAALVAEGEPPRSGRR